MNAMCERLVEAQERSAVEERARIAALEQLRHADRLMTVGKLASGIAHELGTPLNVVGARAAMIADGETSAAESVEYARIITGACDQMTRIIRQLLDFARPRGAERVTEEVARLAQRTLELLEPIAAKRGVSLRLREEGAAAAAEVDAGQVQQVFTNLVVNAIQAMDGGTVEVVVAQRRAIAPRDLGGAETDCVSVTVRDEGSGISAEHLPHVFEPFFTTKDVGQGTGLGLSVAYGIVRDHQGWMEVESEVGRGSEFVVYLPLGGALPGGGAA
jgi:two-component system, NtrC family, sensor kinase